MTWTSVFDSKEGDGVSVSLQVDGKRLYLRHEQDVEPIIEANKAQYNDPGRPDPHSGYRKVASIPMVTMIELMKRGVVSPGGKILDKNAMRKWLNDSDNRAFRTRPEHL